METILTDSLGREIEFLTGKYKLDIDCNDTMDFELTLPLEKKYLVADYGSRVFIPNTEYGGIIGESKSSTKSKRLIKYGFTWRAMLASRIIEPPSGQDYRKVSGELNSIIADLIELLGLGELFVASTESTGASVSNYQFDRYVNLLDGLTEMLASVDYRLELKYIQGSRGEVGEVSIEAVPIVDYSDLIELSQDNKLNFEFGDKRNGVNHLICLGRGELKERQVIHLYLQSDGTIGTTKYYTGIHEIVATYENANIEGETSTEQLINLRKEGVKKLREFTNTKTFSMDIEKLNIEIGIGDIIGGRDYITGLSMKAPIGNKIFISENGKDSLTYKLEVNK